MFIRTTASIRHTNSIPFSLCVISSSRCCSWVKNIWRKARKLILKLFRWIPLSTTPCLFSQFLYQADNIFVDNLFSILLHFTTSYFSITIALSPKDNFKTKFDFFRADHFGICEIHVKPFKYVSSGVTFVLRKSGFALNNKHFA